MSSMSSANVERLFGSPDSNATMSAMAEAIWRRVARIQARPDSGAATRARASRFRFLRQEDADNATLPLHTMAHAPIAVSNSA